MKEQVHPVITWLYLWVRENTVKLYKVAGQLFQQMNTDARNKHGVQ